MLRAKGAASRSCVSIGVHIATACISLIAISTSALAQTRSITLQSFGEASDELIKYIAEIGVPNVINLSAGQTALDTSVGKCGYRSPQSVAALADSIVVENKER